MVGGKTLFRVYGSERFEEVLRICKDRCPHLVQQFQKIVDEKKCTPGEVNLAESIIM